MINEKSIKYIKIDNLLNLFQWWKYIKFFLISHDKKNTRSENFIVIRNRQMVMTKK